jgi:hypothetical protein
MMSAFVLPTRPQLQMGVLALVTDLAFDGSGTLWLPGSQGKLVGIEATKLTTAFDAATTPVTTISSPDFTYVEKIFVQLPPWPIYSNVIKTARPARTGPL